MICVIATRTRVCIIRITNEQILTKSYFFLSKDKRILQIIEENNIINIIRHYLSLYSTTLKFGKKTYDNEAVYEWINIFNIV